MPISADDFNKEKIPAASHSLRTRINKFLQEHKDYAYSEDEIISYLYPGEKLDLLDSWKITSELLSLELFAKTIEAKEIIKDGKIVKHYKAK